MTGAEPKRRNLGRGLDALLGPGETQELPPSPPDSSADSGSQGHDILLIAVGDIHPSPFQPRRRFDEEELEALAASVKAKGILQPLLVRPHPEKPHAFELVAGERRWLAAQRATLNELPAIVRPLSNKDAAEVALVENIQREDLSALEEAEGYRRLIDEFDYTQDTLAGVIGKSRSHIANTMRLLNLPDAVKELLYDRQISAGHGRALLTAPNPVELARKIVRQGLSVRQAEKLASEGDKPSKAKSKNGDEPASKDADTMALERELTEATGLKVSIAHRRDAGQVVIHYKSLEQLDDLVSRLVTTAD